MFTFLQSKTTFSTEFGIDVEFPFADFEALLFILLYKMISKIYDEYI